MSGTAGEHGWVGEPVPRVDGVAKVTGRALYVDDVVVPGMRYGRTVRTTVPHGTLRAIRLDPAYDWTGVALVTAEDIPGKNAVFFLEDDQPVFVPIGGRVMHADEPVALVVASCREHAAEALAHVSLDVDPLPAVLDVQGSLACTVLLRGDDNVFKRFEVRHGPDVEEALRGCDLVVQGTYRTGAQEQMYIETQGMIGWWGDDPATARVLGSLQCPYYVQRALKAVVGLDESHVVVAQAVTGGGFGGKEEYPSMLAAHVALAARKVRAPVKMVYERDEDILATPKRHPSVVRHRLGLRRDGTIVAVDIDVVLDGGAYMTLSPVVLSRAVLHAVGPYRVPSARVVGRAVATNTPPHGAFRGFGAPQTTFAYERQMAKAARALKIDPFELRRRNMLREGDETATGQRLTQSVGGADVLEAVERRSRRSPPPSVPRSADPAVRRGRGIAFYSHGAGFTGSGEERLKGKAAVALAPGGRFEVRTGSTDLGQGVATTFAQIAADALGVSVAQVFVADPDTSRVPDSGPTVASRTCMVVGSVVEQAARALREKLERHRDERGLGGASLAEVGRAFYAERGDGAETCTYRSPPGVHWDDATYTGDAYPVFGWACCLVELSVDGDTYEVTVERCIHAVDVGKAIHPVIVKGQIEGGTLQALGWALWESVVHRDGRVVNHRMTDCIIPTSIEAPEMETLLVEKPYSFGPHGAKGVGEIPMDGPAAAIAAALEDALGVPFDSLPILPETIERALDAGRAAGAR